MMPDQELQIVHALKPELSPAQREHWERVYEIGQRMSENALRVLGRLPLELGLTEN